MQIPEQVARDIVVQEYGEVEITRTSLLLPASRIVELVALGIKADQAQREPKTLGDMAEVLRDWRAAGMAAESVRYVVARVWEES